MSPTVRKVLFDPLVSGDLSLIVPDLSILTGGEIITAPARLTRKDGDRFAFDLHFRSAEVPAGVRPDVVGILGVEDRLMIVGRIEGRIPFAAWVFPPSSWSSHGLGTSNATVHADKLTLLQETDSASLLDEARALFSNARPCAEVVTEDFRAHLIFHGPQLWLGDTRTRVTTSHDFLGETTSSTSDTHVFAGSGWEAALIQKGQELHLHVRPVSGAPSSAEDSIDLVNRVRDAVAFTHGFHPWPIYQELRDDNRIITRRLSAKLNLKQSFLAPLSEAVGVRLMVTQQGEHRSIIPSIADGLARLSQEQRQRLGTLLWNVRSCDLGDLPRSTKMLILCAAFDGLMKLVAGADLGTRDTWRRASDNLGFSWERWTDGIFELWGRHRHDLSHGQLWIPECSAAQEFFMAYPRLGGAFMTVVAAFCGYRGQMSADVLASRTVTISELMQ